MATFPLGIKRFTTKRNLLDDVDASHINDIQAEITAIEDTLGPNPHQDNMGVDPAWRWTTLKARLEYMIRGYQTPAFNLFNAASGSYNTDNGFIARTFPAPGSTNDTHGLFSGGKIKIKRSGWYHFSAQAYFNPTSIKGSRYLQIRSNTGSKVNASELITDTGSQPDGLWLHCSWTGRALKGETFGLYTNLVTGYYPNGRYTVQYTGLNGFMVRDL